MPIQGIKLLDWCPFPGPTVAHPLDWVGEPGLVLPDGTKVMLDNPIDCEGYVVILGGKKKVRTGDVVSTCHFLNTRQVGLDIYTRLMEVTKDES